MRATASCVCASGSRLSATPSRGATGSREKGIKGLGYKESSHFLRNVGLRGYAILDKHILRCLFEVGVLDSPQPPTTRTRYLATEQRLRDFARDVSIDFDELDLVLWSMKTGEILK